jgi:uncharacterized surface protein with fasciclin (FAS1) repeats
MRPLATVAALAAAALTLSACGGDDSGSAAAGGAGSSAASTTSAPSSSMPSASASASGGDSATQPFGAACSAVPKSGKGSFEGMSADPVATAASNNPVLSTLVAAVKKAGLVDSLNTAQGITVFAPTNDAFAKIPKATLAKVLADKAMLTKILTYHVVPQQLSPDQLAGSFPTLEKSKVTVSGSGESFTVGDSAKVVCGNVQTANATVYLIDSVLMPKA